MLNMIASTLAIGWEWSKIGRILGVSPWRWPKKRSGLPVVFPFKKRCELLASLATKEPHRSQSDLQGKTSGGVERTCDIPSSNSTICYASFGREKHDGLPSFTYNTALNIYILIFHSNVTWPAGNPDHPCMVHLQSTINLHIHSPKISQRLLNWVNWRHMP